MNCSTLYLRLLTRFGMLVFFTNLSLTEFQVKYLTLFHLFLVVDGFEWLWMGSLCKTIQLMLEFLKAPLFLLTLMIFLKTLSVILLSMLMVVLSTSLNLFCRITLVDDHLNWLNWLHFFILEGGLVDILIDCMIFLSRLLDFIRIYISTVSFLTQVDFVVLCL